MTPGSNPPSSSPVASYGPVPTNSVFALPEPPAASPAWHLQYASSPRRDLIASVAQRVSSLFCSGVAGRLLTNANIQTNAQRGVRHPTYRQTTPNDEDADGSTPTKDIDNYLKRRGAFELLEVDLVVGGFVCNKSPEGIYIQIDKIFKIEITPSLKKANQITETVFDDLKELQIEGLCSIHELTELSNHEFASSELLDQIPLGSQVKALVISVDTMTDVIYFSLNSSRLTSRQAHHVPLGIMSSSVTESTIPPASPFHHWRKSVWFNHPSQSAYDRPCITSSPLIGMEPSSSKLSGSSFVDKLKSHPLFKNPQGMEIMSKAFQIVEHGSLLPASPCHPDDLHFNLRAAQNLDWALKGVARGAEFAKQNRLSDAIQCYSHALNVEPQCIEAYVGRGAAMIRLNQLDSAVKDLAHALDLEPSHADAISCMRIAQSKLNDIKTANLNDLKTVSADDESDEDTSQQSDTKRRKR